MIETLGLLRRIAQALLGWIDQHRPELELLGAVSLAAFVLTLVALPVAVIYLPEDYFVRHRREPAVRRRRHPLVWALFIAAKNLLGIVFVLAGLAMLVLPGQGLITVLIGLGLMNFPGKYRIEQRLVCRPGVRRFLDRIREKAGKPPLLTSC